MISFQDCTYENTPTFGLLTGYRAPCKSLRIYDGDTLWIAFERESKVYKIKIRMAGYDSAELHSLTEKDLAQRATETLKFLIDRAGEGLSVEFLDPDKYGRALARLHDNNICINDEMIALGMGVVYDGGKKPLDH